MALIRSWATMWRKRAAPPGVQSGLGRLALALSAVRLSVPSGPALGFVDRGGFSGGGGEKGDDDERKEGDDADRVRPVKAVRSYRPQRPRRRPTA